MQAHFLHGCWKISNSRFRPVTQPRLRDAQPEKSQRMLRASLALPHKLALGSEHSGSGRRHGRPSSAKQGRSAYLPAS